MAHPHDIVSRLQRDFDADDVERDVGFVLEIYATERHEAAREIEALRARLAALGVTTAGEIDQFDPTVVRLLR